MNAPKLMAMFPGLVVRNNDGSYYHPAYTAFCVGREWISYLGLENWLTTRGLEYAVSQFDHEAAAREYSSIASFTTREFETPAPFMKAKTALNAYGGRSNVYSQLDD
ncbi:hypothetical protein [uncultured Citrobacter sp.]|uniref:hypothetical protein n=1 Tax=uncultured Citrobacter sp. TaxID=200446 RepID=UPI0025955085|nr:hypothetical protein [uncultured Citrobacter sp.]